MATKYLGAPKYLLKCEATFIHPGESWFEVIDSGGAGMCRIPVTADQAEMFLEANKCKLITALEYIALLSETA